MIEKRFDGSGFIIKYLLFIFFLLSFFTPLGATIPRLYNEMPPYLLSFQERVEEQASLYPNTFFLCAVDGEKKVALTFDDGPGPITSKILDVLAQYRIRATFFVLGERVKVYPEIIVRMLEEGHILGNHSWSHQDLRDLSPQEILKEELFPTSSIIQDLTGFFPLLLRPPYGAINHEAIDFLGALGWKIINWSLDTFDWDGEQNSQEELVEKVIAYHHPGAIILFHDGGEREGTLEALPQIIEFLGEKGYTFTTIDELLGLTPYSQISTTPWLLTEL